LLLGESMKTDQRVKSYGDIAEVAVDFAITDTEYKMANTAFGQDKISQIYIGKKVVATSTAITEATNPSADLVNIEATAHNLESNADVVISGFNEAEYNGTFTITVIDEDNFQYTAASTPSATPATGSGTFTASETWTNAINECVAANSGWYALAITSTVEADILECAAAIESIGRIFIARTADADNLDSTDVNSVLYKLKAFNYDRTATIFNKTASTQYIESAELGEMLPSIPGSKNWAFNELSGVAGDDLTTSESTNILANNGNTFDVVNDVAVVKFGTMASGEYIDVVRGIDWMKARIQEGIYSLLNSADKVPFTNAGAAQVGNQIASVLNQATTNGLIAADAEGKGIYTITLPNITAGDVPLADTLNRLLSGITFAATLASAINKVGIVGRLSV